MKRFYITFTIIFFTTMTIFAQSWTSGTNKLFVTPDTTKVGIGTSSPTERLQVCNGALKIGNTHYPADRSKHLLKFGDGDFVKMGEWEGDDILSFKADSYNFTFGNVGFDVTNPLYKLDVKGKMFLRNVDTISGFGRSYLHWESHKLVMGVPADRYSHTLIELVPGGCQYEPLFSQFSMYHAYDATNKEERIRFCSSRNSWINIPNNFGIGTTDPQYKLDVRGTIRANEILVNNVSGADFVFDEAYDLRPLSEVKEFVQKNQHLPEIPSAEQMHENGVNMNELQMQLLQKIEELTLYIIQQEQRIQELENQLIK